MRVVVPVKRIDLVKRVDLVKCAGLVKRVDTVMFLAKWLVGLWLGLWVKDLLDLMVLVGRPGDWPRALFGGARLRLIPALPVLFYWRCKGRRDF